MLSLTRKTTLSFMQLLLALMFALPAFAEDDQSRSNSAEFSQQELDQMLAPIALYPDALLSQVLEASTYPLEVVQAARWSRAHPELKGDDAVRAAQGNDWDPSVISLTAFPQVLAEMDDKLDWTERLGDAFLAQQEQVSDTVQKLRQKAEAAGNLKSNEQILVEPQGQTIVIEQAAPEIIYVPYYNPTVVYGPWWWPAYPPVYWDPWPGYYAPGYSSAFYWGSGIGLALGFFYSDFDWQRRHVNVVNTNNYYYAGRPHGDHDWQRRDRSAEARSPAVAPTNNQPWQHDPGHRRGVPYRQQAPLGVGAAPQIRSNDEEGLAQRTQQYRALSANGRQHNAPSARDRRFSPPDQQSRQRGTEGNILQQRATPAHPQAVNPEIERRPDKTQQVDRLEQQSRHAPPVYIKPPAAALAASVAPRPVVTQPPPPSHQPQANQPYGGFADYMSKQPPGTAQPSYAQPRLPPVRNPQGHGNEGLGGQNHN